MPHVSIRESEGCDLVEELTGKRPLHVLDPVFLLTADEWREIGKKPTWLNKKKYEHGYLNLNVADPLMVDFSRRDEMLPRERFKAFRFLARALGTAPREKISEVTHDED